MCVDLIVTIDTLICALLLCIVNNNHTQVYTPSHCHTLSDVYRYAHVTQRESVRQ